MNRSDPINELAAAFAKAQGLFSPARKSGTNPHLKNKYATLDDIIEAVREPLAQHSLSFLQLLDANSEGPALTTILLHESGQWLSSHTPIDAMESNRGTNDMQAFGATLTYLKRYALAAMMGISSDEDTDGDSAKAPRPKRKAQRNPTSKERDEALPAGRPNRDRQQLYKTEEAGSSRPYEPERLREIIAKGIEQKREAGFTFAEGKEDNYRGALRANLEMCFAGDKHSEQKRHFVTEYLVGKASTKDLDAAEIMTLHKWMGATKNEQTNEWTPDPTSVAEARYIARQAELDAGQGELLL